MKKLLWPLLICLCLTASPVFGAAITDKSIGGLIDVLEHGATTEMLVGGGDTGNTPVWTTATGTAAPMRAGSPTTTGIMIADAIDASGTISGNLFTPDAADGADIGSAALEFSDIYLADGSIIKFQNDQSVTMTSGANGLTFNMFPMTPSAAPDADYEVANKKYVDDNTGSFDPASPGEIGGDTPAAANFTTIAASEDISPASGKGLEWSDANLGAFRGIQSIVWRMRVNDASGDQDPLGVSGGDWEIADDTRTENHLGSPGVGVTAGIFDFKSTGYWLVQAYLRVRLASGNGVAGVSLYVNLSDNVSGANDYTLAAMGVGGLTNSASNATESVKATVLLKIETLIDDMLNISFVTDNQVCAAQGHDDVNYTYIVFTKLADL